MRYFLIGGTDRRYVTLRILHFWLVLIGEFVVASTIVSELIIVLATCYVEVNNVK